MPHTPGPWNANNIKGDSFDRAIAVWTMDGKKFICSTMDRDVRRESAQVEDKDERHANCVLIAAAPELLEACKRVRKAQLAYGPTDDGTPQGKELEAACDAMASAIRRATGADRA